MYLDHCFLWSLVSCLLPWYVLRIAGSSLWTLKESYSPKCWKMSMIPVWKYEDEHEAEAVWISVVYFLAFEPCIMLKFHTVHQSWYCSCLGHFCLDSEGIPSYGIPKICLGLLNFEVFKKQQNIDLIFCQVMFFLLLGSESFITDFIYIDIKQLYFFHSYQRWGLNPWP